MKKYDLYELQPENDVLVIDVDNINEAVEMAIEYFTVKFKDLIVTIRHQVIAVNGKVQIEVGCTTNQGFIILDTFELRGRDPFKDIFVSKGFYLIPE